MCIDKNKKHLFAALFDNGQRFAKMAVDRKSIAFLCFVILFLVSTGMAFGQTVSVKDLLDYPDSYNNKIVSVEGEAIGETLAEESNTWVNILSQGYSIGVFTNKSLAGQIKLFGDYKNTGDTIKVQGVFFKTCPVHLERDIHANRIEIVKNGEKRQENVSDYKAKLLLIFLIVCLVTTVIYFLRVKR